MDSVVHTKQKIRVVLIDDQEVLRIGVHATLEEDEQIEVVAEGETEADALQLVREHHPDVLLFGLNKMTDKQPCSIAGSACHTIRDMMKVCDLNILVLCRYAHKVLIRAVIRAGASGFMLKDEAMGSCSDLVEVVVTMARKGKRPFSPTLYEKLYVHGVEMEDIPQLTKRRIEIMQTITDNPQLTLAQVADLLGIAESTLRNNLSAIFRALDTRNINGATIECLRLGVIQIHV